MTVPGNAGDKRVRKRGCRSAAAVATRIERGYLKRIRTAGSNACVNSHVDSRGTGTDGGSHPAAERTSTTAKDGGDDTHKRKRKPRSASAELDRHARSARAGRSGRHTGDRQARPVRRRSDEVRRLVVQTEIVPRSCGPAVSRRVDEDRSVVDTKTQREPRQRRKRTQDTDVLHSGDGNCRSRVRQVSQRRHERRIRALEAVRDGVGAQASHEISGTPDECVGVPIQRRHSKQAGCVRENRARLREPIHKESRRRYPHSSDHAGNGGHASQRAPHPEQRQNHEPESDERRDSRDHEESTVNQRRCSSEQI